MDITSDITHWLGPPISIAVHPSMSKQPEEDDHQLTTREVKVLLLVVIVACALLLFGAMWLTQPDTDALRHILGK